MRKMLIVDDEEWIVEGLKVQLPWGKMGIVLTECGRNGQEAVEIIEKEAPDIVLTDIRMPLMDGLELAKYIYDHHIECEVIIISGYADFDYAKQAIAYQVSAYITKPIEREELQETVEKSLEKAEERGKKREKAALEAKSRELSQQYLNIPARQSNIQEYKSYFTVLFQADKGNVFWNRHISRDGYSAQEELFLLLAECTQKMHRDSVFFRNENNPMQYIWILDFEVEEPGILKDSLERMLQRITAEVKRKLAVDIIAGISEVYQNTNRSFEAYLQAKFVVENSAEPGDTLNTFDAFLKKYNEIRVDTESIRDFMVSVEYGNRRAAKEAFHGLAQKWETEENPLLVFRMNVQEILIQLSALLQKYESNMYKVSKEYVDIFNRIWEIKTCPVLEDTCAVLITDVLEYINRAKNSGTETIVSQIKQYMEKHYRDSITLNDMANEYYINPAYLSRAFKKETGINFNDYLNQIRMNKAAFLLENSKMKIYEVAAEVGYENVNYFMRKFKERYNETPKQYKNHKRQK